MSGVYAENTYVLLSGIAIERRKTQVQFIFQPCSICKKNVFGLQRTRIQFAKNSHSVCKKLTFNTVEDAEEFVDRFGTEHLDSSLTEIGDSLE